MRLGELLGTMSCAPSDKVTLSVMAEVIEGGVGGWVRYLERVPMDCVLDGCAEGLDAEVVIWTMLNLGEGLKGLDVWVEPYAGIERAFGMTESPHVYPGYIDF